MIETHTIPVSLASTSEDECQTYICHADKVIAFRSYSNLTKLLPGKGIIMRARTHVVHMLRDCRDNFSVSHNDCSGVRKHDQGVIALALYNRIITTDYEHIASILKASA